MSRGPGQNPLPPHQALSSHLGQLPWASSLVLTEACGLVGNVGESIWSDLGQETGEVRNFSGGLLGVQDLELGVLPASFHLLFPKFPR